jgi:hypothetical protein
MNFPRNSRKPFPEVCSSRLIPSAKGSGVGLAVGERSAGLLVASPGVCAGVDVGTAVDGTVGIVGEGAAIAVEAGVGLGVGASVDDCRWHWQSNKTAAPRRLIVTPGKTIDRASGGRHLLSVSRHPGYSGFRSGTGPLLRKVE